jgi:hypothetical protein
VKKKGTPAKKKAKPSYARPALVEESELVGFSVRLALRTRALAL